MQKCMHFYAEANLATGSGVRSGSTNRVLASADMNKSLVVDPRRRIVGALAISFSQVGRGLYLFAHFADILIAQATAKPRRVC
jgi:hypothetical protein